jgi:hypothetical protein
MGRVTEYAENQKREPLFRSIGSEKALAGETGTSDARSRGHGMEFCKNENSGARETGG